MKPDFRQDPVVHEFAELVRRLDDVLGSLDLLSEHRLLGMMEELLPLVSVTALRLPDIYAWDEEEDDGDEDDDGSPYDSPTSPRRSEHLGRWKAARDRFGLKLGWHQVLVQVYDPFPGSELHGVVVDDLADLLARIWIHLIEGLELYEMGTEECIEKAIWDWRFGWEQIYGRQLMLAMQAIHTLLHDHYDDDEHRFTLGELEPNRSYPYAQGSTRQNLFPLAEPSTEG